MYYLYDKLKDAECSDNSMLRLLSTEENHVSYCFKRGTSIGLCTLGSLAVKYLADLFPFIYGGGIPKLSPKKVAMFTQPRINPNHI